MTTHDDLRRALADLDTARGQLRAALRHRGADQDQAARRAVGAARRALTTLTGADGRRQPTTEEGRHGHE